MTSTRSILAMTPHRYSTVAHLRVKLWITKQTSIIHAIAAPQPSLERDVMFNYTAEPLANTIYQAMAC